MASNFTILEPNNFGGKLAQGINQGLNAGLTSGLQQLANQKLERMQQKAAQHSLLSAFPDIPKEALSYVATLPAKEQLKVLELLGNQRQQEHEQMMSQAQQSQQQTSPETNEMVQDAAYANDLEKGLSTPEIVQQLSPEQIKDATSQLEQLKAKLANNPVGINPFPQVGSSPFVSKQQTEPNQIAQPVAQPKAGGIPLEALVSPKEKQKLIKEEKSLKHQEDVADKKEQSIINKETKPYISATLKAEKAADEGDLRLSRMEKLIDRGDTPVAAVYNLFKNLEEKITPTAGAGAGTVIGGAIGGLAGAAGGPIAVPAAATGAAIGASVGAGIGAVASPIAGLLRYAQKGTSPGTEEFEKLTADFVRSAKDFFPGGRMTDQDLAAFFAMIPTLNQTDSGKRKIIANMRSFNKITRLKSKTMKDIIKENNGKIPSNLELLVDERVGPETNKIAEEFINR